MVKEPRWRTIQKFAKRELGWMEAGAKGKLRLFKPWRVHKIYADARIVVVRTRCEFETDDRVAVISKYPLKVLAKKKVIRL